MRELNGARQMLVFGCIEAKICKKICVGKLSPRSTQSTPLYRSLISKFWLEIAEGLVEVLKVWGERAPVVGRALPTP